MLEKISTAAAHILTGAIAAATLTFGFVFHVEQPPEQNPASQQILVYGD